MNQSVIYSHHYSPVWGCHLASLPSPRMWAVGLKVGPWCCVRAGGIFLGSWLMSLITAAWSDVLFLQPGCLDAVEVAQGCDGPLGLTQADVEPGHLRAEAQDVCHQLLEGPFGQCHAQV